MESPCAPETYGFPNNSSGKESVCSARDAGLIPGLGRFPGGGNGNPVFLPGKSHGQRSLVGYSPKGCRELDTTEHTQTDTPRELYS